MKSKGGAGFVKQIMSMVSCVSRAKCIAMIRSKTDAIKAQLMVTALSRRNKFSIRAIFAKSNNAIDDDSKDRDLTEDEQCKAVVLYNNKVVRGEIGNNFIQEIVDDRDDKYPDLTHTLFDEEKEEELAQLLDDPNSSISAIDMVKNSKEDGESFNLEQEIDEVADLFISKFHKSVRLQKLLSFKRHQQMMETSA